MYVLFEGAAGSSITDIGAIIGTIGGIVGSAIAVLATLKASRLKTETAQLEIKAKTFEVETNATLEKAKVEITATQALLESWREQSAGQAIRIDQVEAEYRDCTRQHNNCQVKCAKLEGKIEMLSTLQSVTNGMVSTQGKRQNTQFHRQDLQEERQNTQEERQNKMEGAVSPAAPVLEVERVDTHAGSVEIKNNENGE